MNMCMNEINSNSSQQKYVLPFKQRFDPELENSLHLQSMNMLRSLWIYFVRTSRLSIVWQWLAITFHHFLYLKECVIILNLDPVSYSLTRETRHTKHKPTAQRTCSLDCMKCTTLDGNPFTQWSLSGQNEGLHGRIVACISQKQLGYLTKLIIH